jgi:hypothetical protein
MLNDAGNSCLSLLNQIINYLNAVETTLSNLQLSWVGQSSDLAQTFTNEWNNATASLCGTQSDPGQGILVRIAEGLSSAAQNYSAADQWAQSAFGQFTSGTSSNSGSSAGNPQNIVNTPGQTITAITETF